MIKFQKKASSVFPVRVGMLRGLMIFSLRFLVAAENMERRDVLIVKKLNKKIKKYSYEN